MCASMLTPDALLDCLDALCDAAAQKANQLIDEKLLSASPTLLWVLAAVNALGANQRDQAERLGRVETRLDTVETRLTKVESTLDDTNTRVRSLEDTTSEIATKATSTLLTMPTISVTEFIRVPTISV